MSRAFSGLLSPLAVLLESRLALLVRPAVRRYRHPLAVNWRKLEGRLSQVSLSGFEYIFGGMME